MDKKTRLIYKNDMHGQEISIAGSWGADIDEIGSMVFGLLVAAGYMPETVAKILDIEETQDMRND